MSHTTIERIIFMGNSITRHGPKPDIGWTDDWGMAASALEKDYVHLLVSRITQAHGRKPEFMIEGLAPFEREYKTFDTRAMIERCAGFKPDTIVLAINENVPGLATEADQAKYRSVLVDLLKKIKERGNPTIYIRSSFWPEKIRDSILREVGRDVGAVFVDISALGGDGANFASSERKFQHDGVARHPGDRGMKAIADAIWNAMAVQR